MEGVGTTIGDAVADRDISLIPTAEKHAPPPPGKPWITRWDGCEACAVNWETPYIPREGIIEECLLPDGCTSYDDPIVSRMLEPLDHFDHPQLRQDVGVRKEEEAHASLRLFIANQCAGLAYE